MYQYRNALVRMRQGDSDRDIARSKTMGRKKLAQVRELADERGWLSPEFPLPDDVYARRTVCAQGGFACQLPFDAGTLARAGYQVARCRHQGQHHPRHAGAQSRLHRQLFLGVSLPGPTRGPATARCSAAPDVQAWRSGSDRFRRRPADHRCVHRRDIQDLVLRDDLVLVAPPVCRVCPRPDRGDLAGLPPARVRVVLRRAVTRHHRQRQMRHHQSLRPRA